MPVRVWMAVADSTRVRVWMAVADSTRVRLAGGDWRRGFPEGAKLRARLLYLDPASKRAGLSALPHLLAWSQPGPVPVLGSVFPEVRVPRGARTSLPG